MKKLEFRKNTEKDSGFGVFETVRVLNGEPLRLKLHYQRMLKSLKTLNIGEPPDFKEFEKNISKLNLKSENFLKIIATKKGLFIESGQRYIPKNRVKLMVVDFTSVNSGNPLLLHKTTDYNFFREITAFAEKHGCYDGIILNEKGNITQTGKCNIYFQKKNGEIITPPLKEGLLPGTVRNILLKRRLIKEETVHIGEISKFKKCFVSNSLIGVVEAELIDNIRDLR